MGDVYRKAQMRAFVRDSFRCQHPNGCTCNRLNQLTAHHVTPRAEGGRSILSNLATVCRAHHDQIHQTPEAVAAFRSYWVALNARRANARMTEGDRGKVRSIEVMSL
jgi:hypothetical protein